MALMNKVDNLKLIEIYKTMLIIRAFEEKIKEFVLKGKTRGGCHLYIGEEAVAAGVCANLNKYDYITSTHRGHGHCIAKGGDVNKMMAELMGKETGYCKGKGGSMHIADLELGILGANGIVGGSLPISIGAGFSIKQKQTKQVVVCFFGDGGSNQGTFHESLNMASVWKLPVVYVCENNQYAVSTHVSKSTSVEDISIRAKSYNMPGYTVDGNDVLAVYETSKSAIEYVRAGKGPVLIEAKTYRVEGHSIMDPAIYRSKDEVEKQKKGNDPIKRAENLLLEKNFLTLNEIEKIKIEVKEIIDSGEKFAESSNVLDPEKVTEDVFSPEFKINISEVDNKKTKILTYAEAIRQALYEELKNDKNVVLFGEDVGFHGGAFRVTKGLWDEFGNRQIFDTPLSEQAIVGCAIGASMTGFKSIAEVMYLDFIALAMDQLINQAAKIRYMFGGKAKLPLVIRTAAGGGGGYAAQHSQSLETWFVHVPGLKVVMPSSPYDAKGLLKTAIRDENPVIFIEHKFLYNTLKEEVPESEYFIPFGKASIKRNGKDITVVATSIMVHKALEASSILSKEGIDIEIIDPRTLYPFDKETIINSVKKTGKLLVVHEANTRCGFGAEVVAEITKSAFDYLDSPPDRIGSLDCPVPYEASLESKVIPQVNTIVSKIKDMLK